MNNLTSRQVKQLKSKAHHLNPIAQVGKNGVNENFTEQISDILEKREHINISELQNCLEDKDDIAQQISEATESNIATSMGNTIILYKQSEKAGKIEFS